MNRLRRLLAEDREAFGLFGVVPEPTMVELMGSAGYDFVIIDGEHTLIDPQQMLAMIRAADAARITPLVRVPPGDPNVVLRVLDAGAQGVVVPHVRSRAEIDAVIAAARYPPEGRRSLAAGRGSDFAGSVEYLAHSNAETMIVAMIEDVEGVAAVEDILGGKEVRGGSGVDAILPGPGDLSASLGVPWQTRDPAVQEAMHEVQRVCGRHRVPFLAMARTPQMRTLWAARGVRGFVLGEDRDLALHAMRERLSTLSAR